MLLTAMGALALVVAAAIGEVHSGLAMTNNPMIRSLFSKGLSPFQQLGFIGPSTFSSALPPLFSVGSQPPLSRLLLLRLWLKYMRQHWLPVYGLTRLRLPGRSGGSMDLLPPPHSFHSGHACSAVLRNYNPCTPNDSFSFAS